MVQCALTAPLSGGSGGLSVVVLHQFEGLLPVTRSRYRYPLEALGALISQQHGPLRAEPVFCDMSLALADANLDG
jgi:hypothetical protein